MPKTINRYDVLISCPSDVGEYVDSIKREIALFILSTYSPTSDGQEIKTSYLFIVLGIIFTLPSTIFT